MAKNRIENQLRNSLGERELRLFEVFEKYEQGQMSLTAELATGLKMPSLTLMAFACLGSKRGCEEIIANINNTILFSRFRKRLQRIVEDLQIIEPATTMIIFLPDLEPKRTWGWKKDQAEITLACMIMQEEAELPANWEVRLWSEVDDNCQPGYEEALARVEKYTRPQILEEETRFFRELATKHPDILTHGRPHELAQRQLTAYAHEGRALERLYPRGILLQTDVPIDRRDAMFAPLRREPLAIIHPFARD